MENVEIKKDSKLVDVMVAQAKHERVDSDVAQKSSEQIAEQAKNPTPHNRYQIAQLVSFAVNEILRPQSNFLDQVADVKRVGFGEKASFKVREEGIRAYIQAKGATTARSKVANKTITLDTIAVSARPVMNLLELQYNQVAMPDLIKDATYQMKLKQLGYIKNVLNTAATSWDGKYYGTGSGVVKATIDPMIRHWMRLSPGGAPVIFGDIDAVQQLAELTGFTASTTSKQFADAIMEEYNQTGMIGTYMGAKVVNMINPVVDGTDEPVFDTNSLFILPGGIDASMRPLKVVYEGDVVAEEASHIDDKTYEIRLDQYFNAAVVCGDRPYISKYDIQ